VARLAHLLAVAGSFIAFVGCNAVLGIDEAHLTQGSGKGGGATFNGTSKASPPAAKDCEGPSSACRECIDNSDCAEARATCLADARCRVGLNRYRVCLGAQCNDASGSCLADFQALEAGLNLGSLLSFSACVDGQCHDQCKNMPLAQPCDLYCGCMAPNCTTELAARGTPLGDCATACANAVHDLTCRWTHCEMAGAHPGEQHCGHAIGEGQCNAKVTIAHSCPDKSQSSYACDSGDDCCSGKCNHNVCD